MLGQPQQRETQPTLSGGFFIPQPLEVGTRGELNPRPLLLGVLMIIPCGCLMCVQCIGAVGFMGVLAWKFRRFFISWFKR